MPTLPLTGKACGGSREGQQHTKDKNKDSSLNGEHREERRKEEKTSLNVLGDSLLLKIRPHDHKCGLSQEHLMLLSRCEHMDKSITSRASASPSITLCS